MSQRFRSSRPSNKARLLRPRSERSGRLSGPPSSAVVETSPVSETISIPSPEAQDLYERDRQSVEPAEAGAASVDDAVTDPPPPVVERVAVEAAPVEAAPVEVAPVEAAPVEVAAVEAGPVSLPTGTPRQLSAAIIPPPLEPVVQAAPEEPVAAASEPWPSMAKVEHLVTETPAPVEVTSAPPAVTESMSAGDVNQSGVSPTSGKKKKKDKKAKKGKEGASAAPAASAAAKPAAKSAESTQSTQSTQKTLLAVSSAPAAIISEAPQPAQTPISEPPLSEPPSQRDHMDSLEPTARSVAPSLGDSSKHRSLSDSSARHERAKGESGRHKLEDDPMAAEFFSVPPPEVEEHFEDLTPQRPPPSPQALERQKTARKVVMGVVAVASLVVLVGVGRWLFGGRPADAQPTATPNGGSNSHQIEAKAQNPEPPNTEPGPAVAEHEAAAATATAEPAPPIEASASASAAVAESASASASVSASVSASAAESAVASASAAPSSEGVNELRKKVMKLLERGDNKGAIEAATTVLKQDETDSMMWLMLGTAYQSMGKMADAREAFNNCVRKGKGGHVGECAYFGGKK